MGAETKLRNVLPMVLKASVSLAVTLALFLAAVGTILLFALKSLGEPYEG